MKIETGPGELKSSGISGSQHRGHGLSLRAAAWPKMEGAFCRSLTPTPLTFTYFT
jgi:hypothetical protein